MQNLSGAFDRTGRVRRPPIWRIATEIYSVMTLRSPTLDLSDLPRGRGHVVLVIPAFLTGDAITASLRRFLDQCGYRSFGWGLGINWGPTPGALVELRRRVASLGKIEGGPISVIGVSLGGLLACDMAYDLPDHIRQVITIASPVRLPTATVIEPIV